MVTFLQRTFTSLVHAHAGRTQAIQVDRSLHDDLRIISLTTQVNVNVYKDTPTADSMDYLPEYGIYTQMQDTSLIPDELLDFHGNNDASDISKFKLEIIE